MSFYAGNRKLGSLSKSRLLAWAVAIGVALITAFPFYWAVRTSLSTQRDLLADPLSLLPVGFTLDNYRAALGFSIGDDSYTPPSFNFWRYLFNTVFVSTVVAVAQVFFSAMAAFALARLNFPLRNLVFTIFISALMVPAIVMLIPNYVLIFELGWINTYQGIIAPSFFMSPYAIFFLRQFFLGINRDLEEAAYLDGAGFLEVFLKIILPIAQGPVITIGLIVFITQWNEYLWPFLVGRGEGVRVLTVALSVFKSQLPTGSPDWPSLMAGTILTAIPIIGLFFVLGRRLTTSIQFTGVK